MARQRPPGAVTGPPQPDIRREIIASVPLDVRVIGGGAQLVPPRPSLPPVAPPRPAPAVYAPAAAPAPAVYAPGGGPGVSVSRPGVTPPPAAVPLGVNAAERVVPVEVVKSVPLKVEGAGGKSPGEAAEKSAKESGQLFGTIVGGLIGKKVGGGAGGIVGSMIGKEAGGMEGAAAAGPFALAAVAAAEKLDEFKGKIVEFGRAVVAAAIDLGGKANPAELFRFNMAVADVQATLGRTLLPVLELMTDAVRTWGDALTSVLPSAGEVREALAPLGDALQQVRSVLGDLAPYLREFLAVNLKALGYALQIVGKAIELPLKGFQAIGRMLGLFSEGGAGLKSSQGAAGRAVTSFSGEDYGVAIRKAGLAQGRQQNPVERLPGVLDRLESAITRLTNWLERAGTAARQRFETTKNVAKFAFDPVTFLAEAARRAGVGR